MTRQQSRPARPARPAGQRQLRVGETIRHALSELLVRGSLRDPALRGRSITVTEVRCSPDLRNATVYVVPLGGGGAEGGGEAGEVVAALQRSAPYLRGRVNEAVALKYSPRLTFALDTSFDEARRIQEVLDTPAVARDLGPAVDDDASS